MSEIVSDVNSRQGALDEVAIREALERILNSPEFHSSKRCREFLAYVVERTISGRTEDLKERTIGMELLNRPASYDPSTDATVRVKAGEVRKRLTTYYAGSGAADIVRIGMPLGGYVPEFSVGVPKIRPSAPWSPAMRWILGLAIVALVAVTLLAPRISSGSPVIRRFWGPALSGINPVLLCVSYVPVYGLQPRVEEARRKPATADDFILLSKNFVGGGDTLALGRLTTMFASLKRQQRVRLGSEVSFHDLRDSPVVLVGYSYTQWKELNRDLRYLIDTSVSPPVITDHGKPTKWSLPNVKPDRSTDEDYAIVSRIVQPDTGSLLVVVAGVNQYGTEAASDLVTDPSRLEDAVSRLPGGWEKKNLEWVLHVRVIDGAPGATTIVASHTW